ncbi:hypothetical protein [Gilliamella sp. Nev3-1]|uniref:hypothetical protein n=1 Tax=Gilliamella sp. Nev3-1 TaxID=3120250 RepID=UPI00159EE534|nr:hypothetical protein [Gilliamella apicola]
MSNKNFNKINGFPERFLYRNAMKFFIFFVLVINCVASLSSRYQQSKIAIFSKID